MSLGTAAEHAARGCGLPKATCMTLLEAGWTLVSDVQGTRWEQGAARLDRSVVIEPGAIVVHTSAHDPRHVAAEVIMAGLS